MIKRNMKEIITSKHRWNEGAIAGLALGGFTIVMMVLSQLASLIKGGVAVAAIGSIFGLLVWAAKFAGCIWLMRFFMLRLVAKYDQVTNQDTRRFGVVVALLSAVLVAAFTMALMAFVTPDAFQEAMSTAMSQYGGSMDLNTQNALDALSSKMPVITFFVMFIYCWLFGIIVSAILSRNIPSNNPFANDTDD